MSNSTHPFVTELRVEKVDTLESDQLVGETRDIVEDILPPPPREINRKG